MRYTIAHNWLAGRRLTAIAVLAAVTVLGTVGSARAAVTFSTAPNIGPLTNITLNGGAQTTATTWNLVTSAFAISQPTANQGWNLTVNGNAAGGKSAVFKQYCPAVSAPCGPDAAGYVAGGYTLPADSLTVNTTSAGWTTAAPKPTYQCAAGCHVDNAAATKIVSAATNVATGTWTTNGSASLSLATPSTMRKLQTNEVYSLDIVWTLTTGP
jgi:hypothetical protein